MLCLSALEYWLFHRGAWFVSLILILYFLAPCLYRLMTGKHRWVWAIGLIVVTTVLCKVNQGTLTGHNVLYNIQFAFSRVPSFVLGMALGVDCKENRAVSVAWLVVLAIAGVVLAKVFVLGYGTAWMIIPLVLYVIDCLLDRTRKICWIEKSMTFLGNISLESYLTNIALGSMLSTLIPAYISSPLFYGKYLQYSIVLVVGLSGAWWVNKQSKKITSIFLQES